jgi:hypothetical protein
MNESSSAHRLVGHCVNRQVDGQSKRSLIMKRIGVGQVFIVLFAVKAMLLVFGLAGTLRALESRLRGPATALQPNRALLEELARRTARIAGLMPGRMECLEQSLVLWYVLRRAGVEADLKFGMRQFPFTAHAWVTYRDEPLNEDPEVLAKYAVFA